METMTLETLKTNVLADGVIDASEVKEIRAFILEDGVIDRQEADFLFEVNDAVTGKANTPAWPLFFANALTAHVLQDDVSPDVLDEDEATWIMEKIGADGQVDEAEKMLLANIQVHATSISPVLADKFSEYGL